MRVLVIGSGGREHALAWKLAQSSLLTELFVAPGNGGTEEIATNLPCEITDNDAVVALAKAHRIDFVVVGPDAQVVQGLGDAVRAAGIACFCPSKAAGQLEGSKGFTKALCDEMGIPTAAYRKFSAAEPALAYVRQKGAPIVIKADGLALGKGVTVAMHVAAAEHAIRDCFDGAFGQSGASVVIEDFLDGEEASYFVLCDGDTILPLATAQDHKRAFDGDRGPNTGGMGTYSPTPFLSDAELRSVGEKILNPWLRGCAEEGIDFRGILYPGIMLTKDGPKVLEFNARFGDPETQVYLTRLENDLVELLDASVDGKLGKIELKWKPGASVCVVMASPAYCSGAAYSGVIRGAAVRAASSAPGSISLAMPKSSSLTVPSWATSTLAGLMSRWTTRFRCA